MRRKVVLVMILLVPLSTLLLSSSTYTSRSDNFMFISTTQSVSASLTRVPQDVSSWRPALILAEVTGEFSSMSLEVTANIDVLVEGPIMEYPWDREITRTLHLAPTGQPNWFITCIHGLPANSWENLGPLNNWDIYISSTVEYHLVVDGQEEGSGSYSVSEDPPMTNLPPIVIATAYSLLEDPELLNETYGLGPQGWVLGQDDLFASLIIAFDENGFQTDGIKFEYKVDENPWSKHPIKEDPLMAEATRLFSEINQARETISNFIDGTPLPVDPPDIGVGYPAFGVYNSTIPSQGLGSYVQFRANATDVDDKSFTSPMGFYYVVDKASSTRVLIVDPWVKLWLLKEDFQLLKNNSEIAQNYGLPTSFKEGLFSRTRIASALKENGMIPFHHWELLGKHYNLSIAWPGQNLDSLLKNQSEGGFEPHVIILSNLRFGLNITDDPGFWNWDLNDIEVDDQTMQRVLINYTKQHHAGFLATRGTLSDWVVWLGPESNEHYKVGARGHVGNSVEDLDILDEKTVAAMLGMPQLALWEYLRDQVAQALALNPPTELVGLAVGSLPMQIPFVPLNSSLDATTIGADHSILEGVSLPFDLPTPSVYNEFGFSSYTQIGWQLAMARHIAYDAWAKSNKTLPLAEETINRFTQLAENVTDRLISVGNSLRIRDSLVWALERIYCSIISGSISGTSFNATFDFHELNLPQPKTIAQNIDFTRLLQLLPVKLIACSENYTAGIVTHDKYWDENGYRSVYFSVEPEACDEAVAETLLKNAVNWTTHWEYQNVTTLLGDCVRVPNDLADAFQNAIDSIPGDVVSSDSIVLVEEGQTIVEINAATAGTIYLLVAHPTCDKVNVTLMSGNCEVQNATIIAEGLTQVTIQAHEEGILEVSISADPDASINPAYIAVIPEFPSFLILPLFMMATLLAVIVYRKKCLKKTWNK